MIKVKTALLAISVCTLFATLCPASEISMPDRDLVVRVDWQEPMQLPPRYRNHCRAENFTGRPYCSDHCGIDSQFFYCSQASFGCCRLGHGYCDWDGLLRCAP